MSKVVIRKNGVNQQQNTVFIGGSGGGHTIQNPSGTDMAQEDKLQFTGNVTVTDDSTNGRTVVEVTDSGHTIEDESGTELTQRSTLQFTGNVTVTDDSTNEKTVVEVIDSGHTIEDASGTDLTQRDVMQVLDGLEAVDDSTNQKTKIKMNLPILSNADWNAMTEQEKTAYKASHYRFGVEVPDTEGVINAEYMKLLWENPNTTQAFPAQMITLISADYDFLLAVSPSGVSCIAPKGSYLQLCTTNSNYTGERRITYVSDTSLSVGNATYNGSTNNMYCIPSAIYGIKKDFQFKVNAIASELSTRADHCFLSDDETTVEDKLEELEQEYVEISYTSSETWATVLTRLRSAVDMSKITDNSRLVPSEYEVYYVDSPKTGQYSRGSVDSIQFVEKTVRIDNQTGYLWGSLSGLQSLANQGVGVGGTLRLYY